MKAESKTRIILISCLVFLFIILSLVPAQAKQAKPIKIGCLATTSGLFAGHGTSMMKGMKVATNLINADGGLLGGRPIKLYVRDVAMNAGKAVEMARQLHTREGINLFSGITGSGIALAVRPAIETMNGVIVLVQPMASSITGKQFSPNVFRACSNARLFTRNLAREVHKRHPEVKKWAHVDPDYVFGHSCWEHFIAELKALDPEVTVVAERWPKFGQGGGYGADILAVKESGAEGLYSWLYGGDLIAFWNEAAQHKLDEKLKAYAGYVSFKAALAMGKNFPSCPNVLSQHYCHLVYNEAESQRFEEAYIAEYGDYDFWTGQGDASMGYTGIKAMAAAIEKAGTEHAPAVAKALEDLKFLGAEGDIFIRAGDHQAYYSHPYFTLVRNPKARYRFEIKNVAVRHAFDVMIPVEKALMEE